MTRKLISGLHTCALHTQEDTYMRALHTQEDTYTCALHTQEYIQRKVAGLVLLPLRRVASG